LENLIGAAHIEAGRLQRRLAVQRGRHRRRDQDERFDRAAGFVVERVA